MNGGPKAAIIDYGMGNLMSVLRSWQFIGAKARLVSRTSELEKDDLVLVFPGQGAISDTMKLLKSTGFDSLIRDWIASNKPFFGICIGLQALFGFSEEGGGVEGLGVFRGVVRKLNLPARFKVPHMGWNNVEFASDGRLLKGISSKDQFYFVHSYYLDCAQPGIIFGTTEYGGQKFTSAVSHGNLLATQFHPEKSQGKGLLLCRNFLDTVSTED